MPFKWSENETIFFILFARKKCTGGFTPYNGFASYSDLKQFDADILLTTYGVFRSDSAKLKKRT